MAFSDIIRRSLPVLVTLSLGVMLAGGGWMTAEGAFSAAWPGFLGIIFYSLVFPYMLFPAALFSGMMQATVQSHPRMSSALGYMAIGYIILILSLYVAISFLIVGRPLPALVYAVGAAVAPWTLLALRDRNNLMFIGMLWVMTLGGVVTAAMIYCTPASEGITFLDIWTASFGTMAAATFLQTLYERLIFEPRARREKEALLQSAAAAHEGLMPQAEDAAAPAAPNDRQA